MYYKTQEIKAFEEGELTKYSKNQRRSTNIRKKIQRGWKEGLRNVEYLQSKIKKIKSKKMNLQKKKKKKK